MSYYDTWVMRDGREIQLCDMTNSHIDNCIEFLMKGILHFEIAESDARAVIRRDYEELPEPASKQSYVWYKTHAWNYVDAFRAELKRR